MQPGNLLIPSNSNHKNNFDFLRLILALTVIYTHAFVIYEGVERTTEPLWNHSKRQLSFGTAALNFFFVISGFLVLQSYERSKSGADYIKKRVLRIYPGFIMVCIVCALLFAPLGTGPINVPFASYFQYLKAIDWSKFWSATLMLYPLELPPSFEHLPIPNIVNGPIWSIWYEFIFYLVVLFAGWCGLFKKKWLLLIVFVCLFVANCYHFQVYQHYNVDHTLDWTIGSLDYFQIERILLLEHFSIYFFAGACFYFYREYIPANTFLITLSFVVLLITIRWVKVFELTQPIFGGYLLFLLVFHKRIRLHNFAKHGDFSYGTYLYGWPVQQVVMFYFGTFLSFYGTLFVSLLLVAPFAFFSWHVVENPMLKLKKLSFSIPRSSAG